MQLDAARLARLFSGKPAILKKGLSASAATRYLTEAAALGMQARMEVEADIEKQAPATSSSPHAAKDVATQRFMESAIKTRLHSPRAPLHPSASSEPPGVDETRTVIDVDFMRSATEAPIAVDLPPVAPASRSEPREEPPLSPAQTMASATPQALAPSPLPELALGSIALHASPGTQPTATLPRHRTALQHLAAIGSLFPKAISRMLQ